MRKTSGTLAGYAVRACAALAAGGIVLASGTAAFAAPAAVTQETFSVKVITDGNTYMPDTVFAFEAAPGEAGEYGGQTALKGVEGAVTAGNVVYSPSDGLSDSGHKGTITYDSSKFTAPGIYHYTLTGLSRDPGTGEPEEGIRYDTEIRDLYVYVQNGETAGSCEVFGSAMIRRGQTAKNEGFVENYGNEDEPDPNDSTHDVTLVHKVTGNQGDTGKNFPYKVKVTGGDGEKYKIVVDGNTVLTDLTSGTEAEFTLKDGQKAQIFGLSEGDRYEFTAVDANKDGDTTTYEGSMAGTLEADDTVVTAAYDRNVAAATGVMIDIAPFGVLAAAAAGVIFTAGMSRRRR